MAGYVRQESYEDGDAIAASDTNNEFDALASSFNNSTGHSHDGTAAEGPVIGVLGDAGVVTPLNKILIDTDNDNIGFWIDVSSSSIEQIIITDGTIEPVTDSDVSLGTTGKRWSNLFVDAATVGGALNAGATTVTTLTASGNVTLSNAIQLESRNAADNADIHLVSLDTSNVVQIAADGNASVIGGTLGVTGVATFAGTTTFANGAVVQSATGLTISNTSAGNELTFSGGDFTNVFSASTSGMQLGTTGAALFQLVTDNTARLHITPSGDIGIGTTSPVTFGAGTRQVTINGANSGNGIGFQVANVSKAFIYANSSSFLMGGEAGVSTGIVAGGATVLTLASTGASTFTGDVTLSAGTLSVSDGNNTNQMSIVPSSLQPLYHYTDSGGAGWSRVAGGAYGALVYLDVSNRVQLYAGNTLSLTADGANVAVAGALSKGSGSFRIDHPLKPDTHQLVHSFTESPQADLLYSGTAELVNGGAKINLDEYHGMTEGTFVALNRNIRVFTTNESDWEPIKGYVVGNILYISCRDVTCSDSVSWLVIGERHDQHMMDPDWTDEKGRVIVEPKKGAA